MKKYLLSLLMLLAASGTWAAQATLVLGAHPSGTDTINFINAAGPAISSMQSGSSDPGAICAYCWWADTGNTLLKQRNGANSAWVTIGPLSTRFATQAETQNASNLSSGTVSNSRLTAGSTSTAGILQLTNSVSSTSTTTAATPGAVKTAYDTAAAAAVDANVLHKASTETITGVKTFSTGVEPIAKNIAKAWARFDCTGGTCNISASYNVSSMTYNSTGDYYVNFTTAMSSANYAWVGSPRRSSNGMAVVDESNVTAPTTTALRIVIMHVIGGGTIGNIDLPASIVVFGG